MTQPSYTHTHTGIYIRISVRMHDRELIKSRSASRHECVPRRHRKMYSDTMTFFLREQIFNFPYILRRIVIPPVRVEVTFPRSCRERKPRGGRPSNATVRAFEMTRSVLADFDTFSLEFPTLSGNSSRNTVTPETWQLDGNWLALWEILGSV